MFTCGFCWTQNSLEMRGAELFSALEGGGKHSLISIVSLNCGEGFCNGISLQMGMGFLEWENFGDMEACLYLQNLQMVWVQS